MPSGTRMPPPSSEASPSLTGVFSKTPTSVLTHEEECMLKTALAVVVVKQRRKSQFQQAKNAQNNARVHTNGQGQGILDRLFSQNTPSNRSSLLLLSHRQHLDRIFQAALAMSSYNVQNLSPQNDPRLDIFHGTCSHLASQLQTWLEEEEKGRAKTSREEEVRENENRSQMEKASTKGECSHWIHQSLMTTPCRATFQVYYHLLQFGNSTLNAAIFNILMKLLFEAYHDRLMLPHKKASETKQRANMKAPSAYSANGSATSSTGSKTSALDNEIDWLTVSWLRLTHRCVQFLPPAHLHSILNNSSATLAHLLLPLETSGKNNAPTLIQTFWEMSCAVPTATAGIAPLRTNTLTPPPRLGTGAKMLLRLGLYRLLYCNLSSGSEYHNGGSATMGH